MESPIPWHSGNVISIRVYESSSIFVLYTLPYIPGHAIPATNYFTRHPPGWRSGLFVAGRLLSWLWIRPQPKSLNFHDAENRQCPCRIVIWHELLSFCVEFLFVLIAFGKIKFLSTVSHVVRTQVPPSGEESGLQNYL
ncbi:hypothetical protein TNCV_3469181 [Trichonephila clavipes]|nr:hypothetical protein TNCV_3469181 [Trichonephila clavipes]